MGYGKLRAAICGQNHWVCGKFSGQTPKMRMDGVGIEDGGLVITCGLSQASIL